jgi:Flp pilus assembly protein TadG
MHSKMNRRPKGVIIVLLAVVLIILLAFMALAVDVGVVYTAQSELQNAVDSAALAAAAALTNEKEAVDAGFTDVRDYARDQARIYAGKNFANGHLVDLLQTDIQLGQWNQNTGFTPLSSSSERAAAVQVTGHLEQSRGTGVALYFAKVVGWDHMDLRASATAVYGSRDIVVVLDYSGSMSDDSELQHIPQMGRTEVEGYLRAIWNDLKAADSAKLSDVAATDMNNAQERITSTNDNTIMEALGLRWNAGTPQNPIWQSIPYPYPPRTWPNYFDYVQSGDRGAAYQYQYGYLTWMDYLQSNQYIFSQNHVPLYATPEQPVTAVKDAVTVFLAYLNQQPTNDRVSLASYTYTDGGGHIEQELTDNYGLIENASRNLHAGYYHNYTNIGGGLDVAIDELRDNGRQSALRFIVLLSDGNANWYRNNYDLPRARQDALNQAQQAADLGFPVVTISLGAEADTALMQQIADMTRGVHFIVPAGNDVSDYEEDLFAIFRLIADHRALKLVN